MATKGASDSIPKVAGGHAVLAVHTVAETYAMAQAGKIRILGVQAAERSPYLPDVPTLEEQGIKGVTAKWWTGITVPAGTPDYVVRKWEKTIAKMVEDPVFQEKAQKLHVQVSPAGAVEDVVYNVYSLENVYNFTFTTQAAPRSGGSSSSSSDSSSGSSGGSNSGIINLSGSTTSSASQVEGQSVTTVTLNETTALAALNQSSNGSTVVIPISTTSDVVNTKIPTGLLVALANKSSSIEIQTNIGIYVLPASEIKMSELAKHLNAMNASDITINMVISRVKSEQIASIQKFVEQHNLTQVVTPVEFKVEALNGDNKVEINKFSSYVTRNINIPRSVDPNTTVGVVQNDDGTLSPVPTQFKQENGKTVAVIKRKTNSVYTVVENKKSFADAEGHWAKEEINTLASKLILSGLDQKTFGPEGKITRAQFAAILVRALGLEHQAAKASFRDVKKGTGM